MTKSSRMRIGIPRNVSIAQPHNTRRCQTNFRTSTCVCAKVMSCTFRTDLRGGTGLCSTTAQKVTMCQFFTSWSVAICRAESTGRIQLHLGTLKALRRFSCAGFLPGHKQLLYSSNLQLFKFPRVISPYYFRTASVGAGLFESF
jgi:hypothetical protein